MAVVESHDCSWEASGCVRRSFLVCFWYDFSASWKIAWKRDSEEAADVDGVAAADMMSNEGMESMDCEQASKGDPGARRTPP